MSRVGSDGESKGGPRPAGKRPAFAGRKQSAWCARMKEFDEGVHKERVIYKFCLEYNQRDA